jgi:3-dehydroquinate dehydratase-2
MEQVLVDIQRAHMDIHFHYLQSNHEGDLIDWIQNYGIKAMRQEGDEAIGIVLNAGGYTHTSVALRDAVACAEIPVVEVHISDISQREDFRRVSLLTDVCAHSIIGHGTDGYKEAVEWIIERVES